MRALGCRSNTLSPRNACPKDAARETDLRTGPVLEGEAVMCSKSWYHQARCQASAKPPEAGNTLS